MRSRFEGLRAGEQATRQACGRAIRLVGLRARLEGLRAKLEGLRVRLEGMRGKIGVARSPHGESRYSCRLLPLRGAQAPKS